MVDEGLMATEERREYLSSYWSRVDSVELSDKQIGKPLYNEDRMLLSALFTGQFNGDWDKLNELGSKLPRSVPPSAQEFSGFEYLIFQIKLPQYKPTNSQLYAIGFPEEFTQRVLFVYLPMEWSKGGHVQFDDSSLHAILLKEGPTCVIYTPEGEDARVKGAVMAKKDSLIGPKYNNFLNAGPRLEEVALKAYRNLTSK